MTMQQEPPPFGFNVIGYASANLGLGNTLRQFVNCLHTRGEEICVLDLNPGYGRSGFDHSLKEWVVSAASDLPYAINLSILGANEIPRFVLSPPKSLDTHNRLNVCFVWWELTSIPEYLIDATKVFDVLIAGSDFVYSVLRNNISGVPILLASHPVLIPETIQPNRKRFKLPEQGLIFFMGFDPHSNIDRKNPFAAIDAFKLAFPDCPDSHLAIKVNYSGGGGNDLQAGLNRLQAYVGADSRIHLIQEALVYNDLLCLYASCDVFISLHRSEGLGLIPLEAMRLGKPVVATAWSGNMSYMNYSNAGLVEFDFVPIEASSQYYGSDVLGIDCKWAEANILQAAAWLRKLAEDPQFRLQLGLKAADCANKYHEIACKVDFVDELKAIWETRDLLPEKNREFLVNNALESKRRFECGRMGTYARFKHELNRHLLWRFRMA